MTSACAESSGGPSADVTATRTAWPRPTGGRQPVQRGERGEVAGVVAGKCGSRETGTQLLDHVPLVHRDRRAELDGHLGRVDLQPGPRCGGLGPGNGAGAQVGTLAPVQHHGDPVLALHQDTGQLVGRGERHRLDRTKEGFDAWIGDHPRAVPSLNPVLTHVGDAVDFGARRAGTRPAVR